MVINTYPASLGIIDDAVLVDTYGRIESFVRAVELARQCQYSIVVAGQALTLLDLVIRSRSRLTAGIEEIIAVIGGYECPQSLELALVESLREISSKVAVIHSYGVAEIDHTCFLGMRDMAGVVRYRLVNPHVEAQERDGMLFLRRVGADYLNTGDVVCRVGESWVIAGSAERLAPHVRSELETWTAAEWKRRTGYVFATTEGLRFQCRRGEAPSTSNEMAFGAFVDVYGDVWNEKPRWGV